MTRLFLALFLAGCVFANAAAAELKVMTVGLVGGGFTRLTAAWQARTGNRVTLVIPPSALDQVLAAMKTKEADAVLLPMTEMPGQAASFKPGTTRPIGRVLFGLGARKDSPAVPIATEAAFKAALAGKTVLINDPATSLNGRMAQTMLRGPGFETATVRGIYASASAVAKGEGDYVVTVLPELSALTVLGEVPPSLGLKIDFGGGVTARATQPELAAQFLGFLTSAEAAAVWKAGGVTSPIP
jgi:ABC-type molybdate transport system substrate-binding protein